MVSLNTQRQVWNGEDEGTPTKAGKVASYLKVYPNPTNGLETFEFKLPCTDAEGNLIIADMRGRTMGSYIIGTNADVLTVDTRQWGNGTYLYRLTCGDKAIGTGRFEVIK
ncbi:MAG: hypothetical protein JWO06_2368 [Bacteroidota bacterium]|nr:hypothetical protein [Bacteroidota bacterium]